MAGSLPLLVALNFLTMEVQHLRISQLSSTFLKMRNGIQVLSNVVNPDSMIGLVLILSLHHLLVSLSLFLFSTLRGMVPL
jgi:hypothetical protein